MYNKIKIVQVDYKYCDYLRKFDDKVSYNAGIKSLRPFIGVLFKVNNLEYFAPLASPKLKHLEMRDTIDFSKIDLGKLGVINFNNMIPVKKDNYTMIDLSKEPKNKKEEKLLNLLQDQLRWLTLNKQVLFLKAIRLYNLYKQNNLPHYVKTRCCDFVLLEEKCKEYND